MPCEIVLMPSFERAIKMLKKHYRSIAADCEIAIDAITTQPTIGTIIPDDFQIRKLRVASRDMQRGKSSGFRLLYRITTQDENRSRAYILLVYAKSDRENVELSELRSLVQQSLSDNEESLL